MTFPDDWREFLRDFSFKDTEEIYTNGCELIPVFRVEQLIEHMEGKQKIQHDNMIPIEPVADFLAGYAVPPILHMFANGGFPLSDHTGLVASWAGFLRRFVDYKPDEIQVLDPGGICPKCKMPIYPEDHPHFCGYCGQAVKWKNRWENDETD